MRGIQILAGSIVLAGVLLAAAIFFHPSSASGRFALAASQYGVTRLDTRSGQMVNCIGDQCSIIAVGFKQLPKTGDKFLDDMSNTAVADAGYEGK